MIEAKLSDFVLVLPLKTIVTNYLRRDLFPDVWKCANLVPVHKKYEGRKGIGFPKYLSKILPMQGRTKHRANRARIQSPQAFGDPKFSGECF